MSGMGYGLTPALSAHQSRSQPPCFLCPTSCSIIAATSRPDLFIRLSAQGMFPARSYHRSQVLLSSDACAAGLFKQAAGAGSGPVPAVVYRSVKSADEAANLLPKVCGVLRGGVRGLGHGRQPLGLLLLQAAVQPCHNEPLHG